ncbi:MAG: hypothetical protein ABSB96_05640 [Gaiellaceae bacterium]
MRRTLAVAAVLVALTFSISGAGAATPQAKQIKVLQIQVKALQKQVKTLQTEVKWMTVGLNRSYAAAACSLSMTVDALQATWAAVDTITGSTTFRILLTPVSDQHSCADITLRRTSGQTVPSLTAFNNMIDWLYGS